MDASAGNPGQKDGCSWYLNLRAWSHPFTPLLAEEIHAVDFLMGKDRYAKGYLSLYRARRRGSQATAKT